MKRGAESSALMAGFTIVETMIVLAVTGLLFVSIATTWFGRQHKTEFQTSAQEVRSSIQQVISDVQNGYFPNQNNFSCQGNSPNLIFSSDATAAKPQGTNYPCVFLGKVVQFNQGSSPEQYRVYTVTGDGSKQKVEDAEATVIAPDTTNHVDLPDNSTLGTLHQGLTLQAYKTSAGVVNVAVASKSVAVGFLSSLGSLDGNGVYNNGTQQVNLYPLAENSIPTNSDSAANAINQLLRSNPAAYTPNKQVDLCFQSGSTNQFAVVTIGGGSSTLTTDLTIKNGKCTNSADFF